jgi:hypothetical protein
MLVKVYKEASPNGRKDLVQPQTSSGAKRHIEVALTSISIAARPVETGTRASWPVRRAA